MSLPSSHRAAFKITQGNDRTSDLILETQIELSGKFCYLIKTVIDFNKLWGIQLYLTDKNPIRVMK